MTSRRRVAIAGCREGPGARSTSLYPDVDAAVLRIALDEVGCDSTRVAWDDDEQVWSEYDLVLIRSTWDSVDRPEEYLAWARRVSQATRLANPAAALEWSIKKTYLDDLAQAGVSIPATDFVAPGESWQPPATVFVVKPAISGGGRSTAMYDETMLAAARSHVDLLHEVGMTAMVQEHLPAVRTRGEVKHVFIGGTFIHAIRADALLTVGAGVMDRPWEVPTNPRPISPTTDELSFATATLAAVVDIVGVDLTYARIDIVADANADPVLMEVELIDPSLFLWASSDSPKHLAAAVVAATA